MKCGISRGKIIGRSLYAYTLSISVLLCLLSHFQDLANMKHVLRVPKTVDCVQNILTVIPLQLMSYHVAELNGYNVGNYMLIIF